MPIGFLLNITAKPGSSEELRRRLLDAVALSRTEPGNLIAVLMADPEDANRFSIFEIYRDEAAIVAHREASYAKESAPIIHALFAKPMEVNRFDTLNWPAELRVNFDNEVAQ